MKGRRREERVVTFSRPNYVTAYKTNVRDISWKLFRLPDTRHCCNSSDHLAR